MSKAEREEALRAELAKQGARATLKNHCPAVLVAPDHTGELNYHNCLDSSGPFAPQAHTCGCGYEWLGSGEAATVRVRPLFS